MIKQILSLVAVSFLAGCATHYKPELTNKPQAKVRMLSNLHRLAWAAVLKESCIAQTTFGWESSTEQIGVVTADKKPDRKSIGMPLGVIAEDASYVETPIPAGQPIALGFSSIGVFHSMACGAGLIFTPQEGHNYQVTYQHTSGLDCGIHIDLIKQDERGEVSLESVKDMTLAPKC